VNVTRAFVAAGAVGLAAAAVLAAHDPGDDVALLVADGCVGIVLVVAAHLATQRRPSSRVGALLAVAGLAWFAGSFVPTLSFLHRGPLVHLHLAYPSGRSRWWLANATIIGAYVAAIVTPIARSEAVTLSLAVLLVAAAAAQYVRAHGAARRASQPALLAAVVFAAALALASLNRLGDWQSDREVLWIYYVAIAGAVVVLLGDLLRARWSDAVVTELVIDLGSRSERDTLRSAVGRALGDPQLEIAYWLPHEHEYVDDAGRRVDLTNPGAGRVLTRLDEGGSPLGALVHDAAVLDDPRLVAAVAEGARLAVSNAAMQAATRERVGLLLASRRRIVDAAEAQRRRLQHELRDRVQRRLEIVARSISELAALGDLPASVVDDLARELDRTNGDLDDFAHGLFPRRVVDAGLRRAISELAQRLAIDLELKLPTGDLPPRTSATAYFVCAEALTNVAKHAGASRVAVEITDGTVTTITVADDGRGGADPARGSGLEGLDDRVQAIGGVLTIESRPGAGTRLCAVLPALRDAGESALVAPGCCPP
jgi:signal transduction histidine kinase